MKMPTVKRSTILLTAFLLVVCVVFQQTANASPFGKGVFGAHVPFGSLTAISVSVGATVGMTLAIGGSYFSGNASQTVTVTSTDVVGYNLYIQAPSGTSMSNGTSTIAASSNSSPASLAVNSWGYNTTGSTSNFIGVTSSNVLINSNTGPFEGGDSTSVTYGALTDLTKTSGTYTVSVQYTAVGES